MKINFATASKSEGPNPNKDRKQDKTKQNKTKLNHHLSGAGNIRRPMLDD